MIITFGRPEDRCDFNRLDWAKVPAFNTYMDQQKSRNALLVAVALAITLSITLSSGAEADAGDPPAENYLIGDWFLRHHELGRDVMWFWTILKNGSTEYRFRIGGTSSESSSRWTYQRGILHEEGANFTARTQIRRINNDTFELTIIDNGNSSDQGLKRIYHRAPTTQQAILEAMAQIESIKDQEWYLDQVYQLVSRGMCGSGPTHVNC